MKLDIIFTIDLDKDLFITRDDFINKNQSIEQYYDGWDQGFNEDDTSYMVEQRIFFYDVPSQEVSNIKIFSYITNIEMIPHH